MGSRRTAVDSRPTGTLRSSSCLCTGLLTSHSPFTSADRPPIERWLTSPQVAHGGMWIYIDPSTAYPDTPKSASNSTASSSSAISPPHPPDRERPKNHGHPRRGFEPGHLAARASTLSAQTWHHFWSSGSRQFALHCLAQRPAPGVGGLKLQRLPARLAQSVEVEPK
jgi:hypothetical protein